jgi:hypothetical protein
MPPLRSLRSYLRTTFIYAYVTMCHAVRHTGIRAHLPRTSASHALTYRAGLR